MLGKKSIRIFLADDHLMVREGIKSIIVKSEDYVVIGEASDGRNALENIDRLKPDVAILDIAMPLMTGIEVARQLKKYSPDIKVIILSQYDDDEYIKELLLIGIDGYILKENASDDLSKALEEVVKGNKYLSPQVTTKVVTGFTPDRSGDRKDVVTRFEQLTNRETEILKLIAEGKTNREIASLLFISEHTVKAHRTNIMTKMGMKNLTEVIRYAIKKGLIEP
jgi:DNA-binding NarL/FixJ family response regulator